MQKKLNKTRHKIVKIKFNITAECNYETTKYEDTKFNQGSFFILRKNHNRTVAGKVAAGVFVLGILDVGMRPTSSI